MLVVGEGDTSTVENVCEVDRSVGIGGKDRGRGAVDAETSLLKRTGQLSGTCETTAKRGFISLTIPPSGYMLSLTCVYALSVLGIENRCRDEGPRGTVGTSSSH
jgi:hypothetical protein